MPITNLKIKHLNLLIMENRNIRHLYVKSTFDGSFYIPKENQTSENIDLINQNLKGFAAISRLNLRNNTKFLKNYAKGKIANVSYDMLGRAITTYLQNKY